MMKKVNGKKFVSAEEFIRIWQAGPDLPTISRRMGCTHSAATARATGYRKHGVPLTKYMCGGGVKYDWNSLISLAKECAK